MKQNITLDQYHDLTDNQKEFLITWYENRGLTEEGHLEWIIFGHYAFPLLSIGQMIEFLGDSWIEILDDEPIGDGCVYPPDNKHLCDALWEAVKEKLNS